MLITFSMSSLRTEKKRLEIKMRSIDLETLLLSKKENAKIMMQRSRASITISTRLRSKLKSSPNLQMLKIMSVEEQLRLSTLLVLSSQEPRMIIQDLWLKLKPFKEILTDN